VLLWTGGRGFVTEAENLRDFFWTEINAARRKNLVIVRFWIGRDRWERARLWANLGQPTRIYGIPVLIDDVNGERLEVETTS
jgi:hypothetical protein